MTSRLNFLVAARQCEIGELEHLAGTSELVGVIGRFIHALQRERGISNIFLGTQGARFGAERLQQVAQCEAAAREVLALFDLLDTDAGRVRNGARLFSSVAFVLHSLDSLPGLRQRIATQAMAPRDATLAYSRLIAGMLAVVFEAADSATDPEISRALVALFNFVQGKEFAGQERACGAMVFACGRSDAVSQQQWQHLIESQEACFQVFRDFSPAAMIATSDASDEPGVRADLLLLRRVGCAMRDDSDLDASLSQTWYECTTRRIDAMKGIEDLLEANLRLLCHRRIAQARAELADQQAILDGLARQSPAASPGAPARYGPQLERSILGMLQDQARRLQDMSDELQTARAALNERKVVERAKGVLMAHRHLTEEDAYKTLRQMAMNQKRRLFDVAEAVLAVADALPKAR